MTEYEILDIVETVNGNTISATGVYFSVLTAYLLVAYVAGLKLTRYQVAFINTVFLFYNVVAASNIAVMTQTRITLTQRLLDMSGQERIVSDEASAALMSVFIVMRVMLVFGAVVFMWQVRHPKTE